MVATKKCLLIGYWYTSLILQQQCSESARKQRIVLYKSDQWHQQHSSNHLLPFQCYCYITENLLDTLLSLPMLQARLQIFLLTPLHWETGSAFYCWSLQASHTPCHGRWTPCSAKEGKVKDLLVLHKNYNQHTPPQLCYKGRARRKPMLKWLTLKL